MANYGYRLDKSQAYYPDNLTGKTPGFSKAPGYMDGTEVLSTGALTYLQLIGIIKHLWEKSYPSIPIVPVSADRSDLLDNHAAAIGYSLELRKAATNEPKPRLRENILDNNYSVYGQKFHNIIGFTVMSKVGTFEGADNTTTRDDMDAAVLCDQLIETFEDFMQEFTPVFKAAGASDLVYSRRISDTELNRESTDVHKRTVTYMVTTEKTFVSRNDIIQSLSIDLRLWIASNLQAATTTNPIPDTNIVDLNSPSN